MGTSSDSGNYSQEIDKGLAQANLPKSTLAQQFSGELQGSYLPALAGLLNAGSLGNAFPGRVAGGQTPGMIFNQNPLGFTPQATGANIWQNNGPTGQGNGNGGNPGGNTGDNSGNALGAGGPGGNANNANGQTYLPGTNGYFQANAPGVSGLPYAYAGAVPGLDIGSLPTGTTFNDLLSQGKVTLDDLKSLGITGPNDPVLNNKVGGLAGAAVSGGLAGNPGYTDPTTGQFHALGNGPSYTLQNGQYLDSNGNPLGLGPNSQTNPNGQVTGFQGYQNVGGTQTGTNNNPYNIAQANPLLGNINTTGMNAQASNTLLQPTNINPLNDQYYQGLVGTLNNSLNQQRADLNARFGSSGGTSRGTPAAYANAQFDAQTIPQLAATLGSAQQQSFTNQLGQAQLNQTGANSYLGNQSTFQNNQNTATLGLNQLLSQLAQYNSGQLNTTGQQYSQQQQSANQSQINNQLSGYQNILSLVGALAGSGIPGGSANINLGANSQGTSQQTSNLLGSLAGLF